jgi:hypothetical protein
MATKNAHCGELGFPTRPWKKEWRYEKYEDFSERFTAVLETCRVWLLPSLEQ